MATKIKTTEDPRDRWVRKHSRTAADDAAEVAYGAGFEAAVKRTAIPPPPPPTTLARHEVAAA
jgi:hypothetical protein